MSIEVKEFLADESVWGEPGKRPHGMSELQVGYCRARLSGCNITQSAKRPGYSGDDKALSVSGSRCEASPKVRTFLQQMREKAVRHRIAQYDVLPVVAPLPPPPSLPVATEM